MPSEDAHVTQAYANARFLDWISQPPLRHPDWVITAAFYAALHLADAYLAREGAPHWKEHPKRNAEVSRRLTAIAVEYQDLYIASRRARYDCGPVSPDEAHDQVKDNYEPIRTHICGLLGIEV